MATDTATGADGRLASVRGALGFLGTGSFRLALAASAVLAAATLLQFWLIYWRTAAYTVERSDRLLDREAALMVAAAPADLRGQLRLWSRSDLHLLITAAGLFDADRRPLEGDLHDWPATLPVDGTIHEITVHPADQPARAVRAEALPVPGGRILVIGRSLHSLQEIRGIVLEALETALIPVLLVSLLTGAWLGRRNLARARRMQRAIDRIMDGDLHERLPVRDGIGPGGGEGGVGRDEMERLAASVNRMLDRIEHLLTEIRGVGDDIAHDLRTPLARVRAGLERASRRPALPDVHQSVALQAAIDRAVADLDQCFAIVTALLRIGEIDSGQRRSGFATVPLRALASGLVELYEPVAEAAGHRLLLEPGTEAAVAGDPGLLGEALANLVDNAIKFSRPGGLIALGVNGRGDDVVLRVADGGIGIAPEERAAVLRRFYRSDKSRHIGGSGLGLSLVAAIARLHGARLAVLGGDGSVASGPGTVVELVFAAQRRAG